MSIADTVTKQYLQDNEVFSDVFNYQLFDGEQVIHPEDLTELDPSEMLVLSGRSTRGKQSKLRTRNLFRDLMKNSNPQRSACCVSSESWNGIADKRALCHAGEKSDVRCDRLL